MSTPNITDLQLLHEYREARQRFFPSEHSALWYVRTNREALVRAGALLKIGGRTFVQPAAFDEVILKSGAAAMERAE